MNFSWEVRSNGRVERIIIVFTVLLFFGGWFVIYSGLVTPDSFRGKEMSNDSVGGLFVIGIFFIILGIPILLGVIPLLFNSKLPRKVSLNLENNSMTIAYKKNEIQEIDFANLAFAFDEQTSHASLILYRTYIGTRGQIVTNKLTEIISIMFTISWKKEQLREMTKELLKLEIDRIECY